MKKRVFIAIIASPKIKGEVLCYKKQNQGLPVRWMIDENLHITIIPPHDLSDNEIVEWIEKLKKIEGQFGPVEVEFDKICLGPKPRRPHIIWAKGEENYKLESLKNKILEILKLRRDGRPYFAHLTLARFRPNDYHNFANKNLCSDINWLEIAEKIYVVQSELFPGGARYTNLAEIRL